MMSIVERLCGATISNLPVTDAAICKKIITSTSKLALVNSRELRRAFVAASRTREQ